MPSNTDANPPPGLPDPALDPAGAGANLAPDDGARTASPGSRIGRYRWVICALLFFATTINYLDRLVLSILAPTLQEEIGWNEFQYGVINGAFTLAYAVGLLVVGGLMDRWGTRRGFTIAVAVWSAAAMAHAFARGWVGFAVARFALGLSEAGNFPGAVKTVAEWFPRKERALATGIFNAGSNVGAILAPLLVPLILYYMGWRWAFILTGSVGFFWLVFWLMIYRRPEEHPRVGAAELAHINSDPVEPRSKIPWARLLPHRQTWAFGAGKILTDPVWWFFLFWLPKFFSETYGVKLAGLAVPLVIIYVAADIGSIGGGWLSGRLIKNGWSVNAGRKIAMLVCALCVVPMALAPFIHNLWVTVAIIALAAAAHQGWSANLFTLTSDMFPRRAVASVVGIGGMGGALSGFVASLSIGAVLQLTDGNYVPLLVIGGFAYVCTLFIIHLLVPRLEPVNLGEASGGSAFAPQH